MLGYCPPKKHSYWGDLALKQLATSLQLESKHIDLYGNLGQSPSPMRRNLRCIDQVAVSTVHVTKKQSFKFGCSKDTEGSILSNPTNTVDNATDHLDWSGNTSGGAIHGVVFNERIDDLRRRDDTTSR